MILPCSGADDLGQRIETLFEDMQEAIENPGAAQRSCRSPSRSCGLRVENGVPNLLGRCERHLRADLAGRRIVDGGAPLTAALHETATYVVRDLSCHRCSSRYGVIPTPRFLWPLLCEVMECAASRPVRNFHSRDAMFIAIRLDFQYTFYRSPCGHERSQREDAL